MLTFPSCMLHHKQPTLLLALSGAAWLMASPSASRAQALPPVTVSATRTEQAPFDVPASVDVVDG
ncbi:MAG: hypothetical protein JWQ72_1582, partial [Polaromonas sp.]|nr:hypothetical protein [Polaromonas sp.]